MKKYLILSLAALTLASVGAMAQGESNVPEGKRITCYHVYSDKAPHFSPKRGDWSPVISSRGWPRPASRCSSFRRILWHPSA